MNNPFMVGALLGLQRVAARSPLFIGAPVMSRARYEMLGGVRAATACATGGWDDLGWSKLFERRGQRARMRHHAALVDHSHGTDFRTFWGAWIRWKAGVFTFTNGGWLVAGGVVAQFVAMLAVVAAWTSAWLVGDVPTATAWAWTAVPVAYGLVYCRWAGEPRGLALTMWLTVALNLVSVAGAVHARLRNRVEWREEVFSFGARPLRHPSWRASSP